MRDRKLYSIMTMCAVSFGVYGMQQKGVWTFHEREYGGAQVGALVAYDACTYPMLGLTTEAAEQSSTAPRHECRTTGRTGQTSDPANMTRKRFVYLSSSSVVH